MCSRPAAWLAGAVLAGVGVSPLLAFWLALPVELSAAGWLAIGGAHLLLGALLATTLLAAASHGRLAAAVSAALVAGVLVWTVREHFWIPVGKAAFAAAVVLVAALVFAATARARAPARRSVRAAAVACALALAALAVSSYRESGYLRWILLRHARVLGTPLHLLLDEDLELAAARRIGIPAIPPPAAGEERAPDPPHAPDAPSVVFLLIDTLRADALAPWGGAETLPAFASLARDGVVFGDVLADSSWTKPSVASFFTGLAVEEHGVRSLRDSLAPRHRTLAERFQSAGYRTAAFVANIGQIGRDSGFAQGFDQFFELLGVHSPYARAARVREVVSRWLDAERPTRPVFLYLHFMDPHAPLLSGEVHPLAYPPLQRAAYRAEVRYLDGELAALLASLRERLGDPVLFLTSDHGEEFGEHGGAGHGYTLHQEVVKIPAILAGAGIAPGTVGARLEARDFYDLLPRFAAGSVDVRAWAAAADREIRRSTVFYRWPRMPRHRPYLATVVAHRLEDRRWVYLRSLYGETRELYDLTADPRELRNLGDAHAAELERLEGLFRSTEPRWSPPGAPHDLGEAAEQLRALGYL